MNELLIKFYLISVLFAIEIMKTAIKHAVMGKHDFNDRDETIIMAIYGVFGLSGL